MDTMKAKTINTNVKKRTKEINFYCQFNDEGATFQDELNTVFANHLRNNTKIK